MERTQKLMQWRQPLQLNSSGLHPFTNVELAKEVTMDEAPKKTRARLWVFYGFEGDRDVASFATWGEFRKWRKQAPRVTVYKMIRGHERDPAVGRKTS